MKKTLHPFSITMVATMIFIPCIVTAANPELVASVRDNDVLSIVDVQKEVVMPSVVLQDETIVDPVLKVYGIHERLGADPDVIEEVIVPEEIHTQAELEKFMKMLVKKNQDLSLIVVTPNSISMTRSVKTKLFSVITVPGNETAEVISWGDGTSAVTITRPWWSALSSYDTSEVSISNDLFTRMKTISPLLFTDNLSANTKARIINEIKESFSKEEVNNNEL